MPTGFIVSASPNLRITRPRAPMQTWEQKTRFTATTSTLAMLAYPLPPGMGRPLWRTGRRGQGRSSFQSGRPVPPPALRPSTPSALSSPSFTEALNTCLHKGLQRVT